VDGTDALVDVGIFGTEEDVGCDLDAAVVTVEGFVGVVVALGGCGIDC